jgi:hypothetical protein
MTFEMRQSTLATFSRCPLAARFEIETGERHAPELARGTLAHRCMEEILRTLHRQGAAKMPQQEGIEIMYEVLAHTKAGPDDDVLVLPPEEKVALRQFVVRFCTDWEWRTDRILALEEQLRHEIVCQDGAVRTLTGTPDVLIADPAQSAVVIVDAKSGWRPPSAPRGDESALTDEQRKRYLTERGHYQLDAYGLLALKRYPAADKAILWEIHPRVGEKREAALHRDELEHIERLIGIDLMLIDQGTDAEGAPKADTGVWRPTPGKHCSYCLRPRECPRAPATRGEGAIDSPEAAREFALDVEPLTARRDHTLKAAKAWVDEHGPIDLGDGRVLGWQPPKKEGGSRSFCVHTPEPPEEDTTDWAGAFEAQARANEAARA